jgi:SHS2 domain-containing protein
LPRYRLIDHTADLGAYFYGPTPEELLVNAGLCLFKIILAHPPKAGDETAHLEIEGTDHPDLLIRWLGELLYLFQVQELVPTAMDITLLSRTRLLADLRLARLDPSTQCPIKDIKAATYHKVEFAPHHQGWRARVIFDL